MPYAHSHVTALPDGKEQKGMLGVQ